MEYIIVLSEWSGNSWGGANIIAIVLACAMTFCLTMYFVLLFMDKESWGGLLVLSIVLAFLLWFPLNDCIQHRGETFQKICAPTEVTEQQLLERYDTVKVSNSDYTPDGYNCWVVNFKRSTCFFLFFML